MSTSTSTVQRIEALAGAGRYTVTFRGADGGEQSAVVQLRAAGLEAAEASLPPGWTRDTEAFTLLAAAVAALDAVRAAGPRASALVDVEGGWDVMLGNIVLVREMPTCTAHGALASDDGAVFACAECGARAVLAG